MNILGVNSVFHESAACLLQDGVLRAAVEEERLSRVKHAKAARVDNPDELPWRAIEWCLTAGGIAPSEVRHVAYSFDPEERLQRQLAVPETPGAPPGDFGTHEGERVFYSGIQRARNLLRERFPAAEFHFVPHHLAHAASAYLLGPWDRAAVLAVDGIGEFASTWMGLGEGTGLREMGRVEYPNSLGFLWERMSELLGFDIYSGPGKVMGYAGMTDALGEASGVDYSDRFRQFVHLVPGSFQVDDAVTRFRTPDLSGLERLFGPRRPRPVDRYEDASVAAGLQAITEEVLVHLARWLYERVNDGRSPADRVNRLCMAGGVALNCVANHVLLTETPFESLWVQPAAHDGGTAGGAAAYVWNVVLGGGTRPRMAHAYVGPGYGPEEMERALTAGGLTWERPEDPTKVVVDVLDGGGLVAWFDGRLECGPRALGHRSILGDPSRFDMRNRINQNVKYRESFRPFAPSVLAEEVPVFFATPQGKENPSAEYMLSALPLRDRRSAQLLAAVVQENLGTGTSTSRIHVVRRDANPAYHHLLTEWKRRGGHGVLLNTSFNIQEPIVCTPTEAVATFGRSGMDLLAMGPFTARRPRR